MVVAFVLVMLISGFVGARVSEAQRKSTLRKKYQAVVDQSDQLWNEYQKAVKDYHDREKTSDRKHLERIWDIESRLIAVHNKWAEMPLGEWSSADMAVGLCIQLQLASISAESIGMLDDDEDAFEISDNLDHLKQKRL